MFLAKITVKFKKCVKNPEAQTLETLLARIGEKDVQEVICSKSYELVLVASDSKEAFFKANNIANKALANPIIEDYEVEICELP